MTTFSSAPAGAASGAAAARTALRGRRSAVSRTALIAHDPPLRAYAAGFPPSNSAASNGVAESSTFTVRNATGVTVCGDADDPASTRMPVTRKWP